MWLFQLAFMLFMVGSHVGLSAWFVKFFKEMGITPIYAICWALIVISAAIVIDSALWSAVQPNLFPIAPR